MTWNELYPIVKDQAYWSVMRYDPRRSDKISELIAQSFEKYQRDVAASKPIIKQNYKCFVTRRAKSVDVRSICKQGYGGTSIMDPLSFYRRRPDSTTSVVEFDDWMTSSVRNKQVVEDTVGFHIDFNNWISNLNRQQRRVLEYLLEGYKGTKIAELMRKTYTYVRDLINQIQKLFVRFFCISVQYE